jgi:cyclopropane-fatty-acyl-phospholipid synthase
MKYSSGLYLRPEDTFQASMINMVDKHLSFLDSYASPKILEIGCGWGALLKRLQETRPHFHYRAINPSSRQNHYIKARINQNTEITTDSFENVGDFSEKFDLIYLLGSFCHLKNKEEQISKLSRLLKENGRIIFEDTFFISDELFKKHVCRQETRFVQQTVFGFAEIWSLAKFLNIISEHHLAISQLLEHSDSYFKTIEEWISRLSRLDAAKYPQVKDYIKYMKIGQRGLNYTIANYLICIKPKQQRALVQ